ncbi:MAG TPA: arylsulfatase [Verrucomicrobiae bacterium]|nr:arylsulfatase [Verrucomicrobiae bacterium]
MRTTLALLPLLALPITAVTAPPPKPNVVIILADDLGHADVGFAGGKEILTPNIDRIATSGARLAQFYVQPLCSPTRAALLTGRYPMRYGLQVGVIRPWEDRGLPLAERTLPSALKEAGYQTAIVGKWHLGHNQPAYLPTHRGFDHQYGHYCGAIDYFTHDRDGGFDWHRDDRACHDEGYSTHLVAREATRLIRERERDKPLFLYVPFNAVHAPHQVPDTYKKPYASLKEPRQTYAGMVAAMDEAIGQILEALASENIQNNTLVFFSSDNGGPNPGKVTDNGPLRAGKGTLYEGGARVCACVSWPGQIKAGIIVDQPLHIVDWYPTLLRLAGAPLDQPLAVDGRDIWPALTASAPSPHPEILINVKPTSGAIRAGDWKLVLNGGATTDDEEGAQTKRAKRGKKSKNHESVELFNLAEDIGEKSNRATEFPDKVNELRARYDALAAQAAPPANRPKAPDFKSPPVWGE